MNLKITDNDIEIAKVNVVGGVNSSGKSTISKLLYCLLKSETDDESLDYLMDSEGIGDLKNMKIEFENTDLFSDVFYIDTISPLDLKDSDFLKVEHIRHLKESLEKDPVKRCETSLKIRKLIKKDCLNTNSAGVKEIGVIQLLLENNSLKENSFLIIDEPESSLHPDWQIRYAEILILLACELDITLYLNSYSPIFIEALSLYCQYYDLTDKCNFYLTEDCEGFSFKKISPKNMGAIYENLTKSYDELDKLKAKMIFREQ